MQQLTRITIRVFRSTVLHQGFWIGMLLIHLPAMITRWQALLAGELGNGQLLGFAALNLSTLFFALKVAGVRWLTFHTSPTALMALVVAVVLLHAGVVSDGQPLALHGSHHFVAGALVAGSLMGRRDLNAQSRSARRTFRTGDVTGWRRHHPLPVRLTGRHFRPALEPRAPPVV